MSYAICQIVFGVPLNANDTYDSNHSEELEEMIENEDGLVLAPYSGSGDIQPAAFGVRLGCIDECVHHVDFRKLQLEPTSDQITEYFDAFRELDEAIQEEIQTKYGEPTVFGLWSTS